MALVKFCENGLEVPQGGGGRKRIIGGSLHQPAASRRNAHLQNKLEQEKGAMESQMKEEMKIFYKRRSSLRTNLTRHLTALKQSKDKDDSKSNVQYKPSLIEKSKGNETQQNMNLTGRFPGTKNTSPKNEQIVSKVTIVGPTVDNMSSNISRTESQSVDSLPSLFEPFPRPRSYSNPAKMNKPQISTTTAHEVRNDGNEESELKPAIQLTQKSVDMSTNMDDKDDISDLEDLRLRHPRLAMRRRSRSLSDLRELTLGAKRQKSTMSYKLSGQPKSLQNLLAKADKKLRSFSPAPGMRPRLYSSSSSSSGSRSSSTENSPMLTRKRPSSAWSGDIKNLELSVNKSYPPVKSA